MRGIRRWVTGRVSGAAVECAPWLAAGMIDGIETALAWAGPRLPVLSRIVADNMRAVGLYTPDAHREYFRRMATHVAGWMHFFRLARAPLPGPWRGLSADLARIAADRVLLDPSVGVLREAASGRRGVIVMGMHVGDPPMCFARMSQEIPLTVLARHSKDPHRQRIKERWWRASGMGYVALPSHARQRGSRLAKMAEVLQEGRVMVITPDLARKREEGRAVRFFGREIHLPSGAAVLSVMTGAPLLLASVVPAGRAFRLTIRGPFAGTVKPGAPGWEEAAIAERLQWFADGLEAFLRAHAPLWFLWVDKRWTRVFQGDPRYVRALDGAEQGGVETGPPHGGSQRRC